MKIFSIILAAMLFLPIFGLAENESVTMGPYKVTFDLAGANNMVSYHVEPVKMRFIEDLGSDFKNVYLFDINISRPSAYLYDSITVEITEYNSTLVEGDESFYKAEVYNILRNPPDYSGSATFTDRFDFAPRIIDGVQGYAGSGEIAGLKSYAALFRPAIDPKHVECRIFSFLVDWNEGTVQLLKTIHVERINATT